MPDPRIPIGATASDPAAYLTDGDTTTPAGAYKIRFTLARTGHTPGCACCAPRGPAAAALATMFRDRAIGAAPFFTRIAWRGSTEGWDAVRSAVVEDALTAARFRLEDN